jgi:hypothetical protein
MVPNIVGRGRFILTVVAQVYEAPATSRLQYRGNAEDKIRPTQPAFQLFNSLDLVNLATLTTKLCLHMLLP